MPLLSIFAASAQVGVGADAAHVEHGKGRAAIRESGGHGDVETAVAIEEYGPLAVALESLAIDEEHGNLGPVLAGVEHLLGDVVGGVEFHFGRERRLAGVGVEVEAINRGGEGVGREVVIHQVFVAF